MRLTSDNLNATIKHCLFSLKEMGDDGTPPENAINVRGVLDSFYFHPDRLFPEEDGHCFDAFRSSDYFHE